MKKTLLLLCVLLALGLGLSACNKPCTPADLEPPTLTSPGQYTNVGASPTIGSLPPEFFQWNFNPTCSSVKFGVSVSTDPKVNKNFVIYHGIEDEEAYPGKDWVLAVPPLEPVTQYFWDVYATVEGVRGPDSPIHTFFTGPECTSASELEPPSLIKPGPGLLSNDRYVELHFTKGTSQCLPDGYFIDLQTDPNFGGESLVGHYYVPTNYVTTGELDCTQYYWRVAATYDGVLGPWSNTRSFGVWNPDCPEIAVSAVPDDLMEANLQRIACDPGDLTPPELLWPPQASEVSLLGLESILPAEFFQWSPINCFPDKYKIRFSHDPDWGIARAGMTDGQTVWPLPDAEFPQMGIEPATEYFWNVRAWDDGMNGPDSPTWIFFTGPSCATVADLGPPELIYPEPDAVIPALEVELNYTPGEPKCIPDGYYIDLQTVADFSGTSLYDQEWSSKHTFFPVDGLQNCTMYYWRVAAIEDMTLGDFSESRSFFTNESGFCALSLVPQVEALRDLACYQGPIPGTYPILGYLLMGETAPIVAQSLDMEWWYIQNPDGVDICAVRKDATTPEGDTGDVPKWNNPKVEPEDDGGDDQLICDRRYTNSIDCQAAGCKWVIDLAGAGTCTYP